MSGFIAPTSIDFRRQARRDDKGGPQIAAKALQGAARTRHGLAATLTLLTMFLASAPRALAADPLENLTVIGLTDFGRLVKFKALTPSYATTIGKITGLAEGDKYLVGIDYRVQDKMLYGVGNGGGIYTLDTTNAKATLVGKLTVPLSGKNFGVDFNPAANALRIVSDTGQNLRHPFGGSLAGQTQVDATLTYTQPPVDPTLPRPAPEPAPGITAVAYTNNDLESDPATASTATTLFGIDTNRDQIVIQSPPNNGILAATAKLGIDAGPIAGFDIYTRLAGGLASHNFALAVLNVGDKRNFYFVNLLTGRSKSLGTFYVRVADVALPLEQ